jgi:thiol:disulfide interchange protein
MNKESRKMNLQTSLLVATTCIAMAVTPLQAEAISAPMVTSVSSLSELSVPDRPYDESVNADAAVDAAFAQAKAQHKRVLIDLGGNRCADCRVLAGILELPEVKAFVLAHYVPVNVDVGRFNKNLQIPARFGITERLEAVPSLLIADTDGTLVDRGHIAALADARSMTPQAIADWLAEWAR